MAFRKSHIKTPQHPKPPQHGDLITRLMPARYLAPPRGLLGLLLTMIFPSRPQSSIKHDHRYREWLSDCGQFRVLQISMLSNAMPPLWWAQTMTAGEWKSLGRQRSKGLAEAACRSHALAIQSKHNGARGNSGLHVESKGS